jgi:hypothetical protein
MIAVILCAGRKVPKLRDPDDWEASIYAYLVHHTRSLSRGRTRLQAWAAW